VVVVVVSWFVVVVSWFVVWELVWFVLAAVVSWLVSNWATNRGALQQCRTTTDPLCFGPTVGLDGHMVM
jgi:hypothetical protein